uniref:Uncharacterized protein n=1 Tax=Oncorhynchus tshawytscha TaxID=74940 RepID=A0A8C8C142_ONCTS
TYDFDLGMALQTHETVNASHGSVNMAALPTGSRGGMREDGELNKPDLATYMIICLLLFLLVLLIVFFINCQLRNSFFNPIPTQLVTSVGLGNVCNECVHGGVCYIDYA